MATLAKRLLLCQSVRDLTQKEPPCQQGHESVAQGWLAWLAHGARACHEQLEVYEEILLEVYEEILP